MLALKIALYIMTIASGFIFAFWELKLKRQLTEDFDNFSERHEGVSNYGILANLSKMIRRERFLESLPRNVLFKYRGVVSLKFLFILIFIAEIVVLQR